MVTLWFLLRRYLLPEKSNLMGLAVWISVAGVALGIIQLMVVLSVMSGFQDLFQQNYTKISSDIVVIPRYGHEEEAEIVAAIKGQTGVLATTPVMIGQGMILKNGVGGVVLEGIDPKTSGDVTPWEDIWTETPLWEVQEKDPHWMWLGNQLAKKLKVKAGDTVHLMVADKDSKKIVPFRVTAITKFGIYDHDLRFARVSYSVIPEIFGEHRIEPMYKIKTAPGAVTSEIVSKLKRKVGHAAVVKPWHEVHQNIFLAVQHQKKLLFLVLEIVIALAAMNLVNLLMMSSYHRKRDIAILRAMGMRLKSVFLFFVAQGALVGVAGIALGVSLGLVTCRAIEQFQPAILAESIYNVTRLPMKTDPTDVIWVCVVALFLCIVFSVAPAWRAALSQPVESLRYE